MIIVHHLENSRSQRILWLLEELGVDYEVKRYERDKVTNLAPEALKKIHPLGKSPVIEDDGKVIAETGAIIEYLVETHGDGSLLPAAGTQERLDYRYWMHFAEGSFMAQLVMKLLFTRMKETKAIFPISLLLKNVADRVLDSYINPNIKNQADMVEALLSKQPWFTGENFSAADIQMSFPLEAMAARAKLEKGKSAYPKIDEYVARIQALPTYQRALERGGPYAFSS